MLALVFADLADGVRMARFAWVEMRASIVVRAPWVGGAAISVLARRFGYALKVVDVGVKIDTSATPLDGVIYRRIGPGTANLAQTPAMTPAETTRALEVGIEVARDLARDRATLVGIGEMGIANSTSAAAILSAIRGLMNPTAPKRRGIGFTADLDEK